MRLENSIKDGIEKYGEDKEIIVCMHYPPIIKENTNTEYAAILQKYKVKNAYMDTYMENHKLML